MLFSSMEFLWVFLPLVFIIYRVLEHRFRNWFLMLVSVIFYAWGEPSYVVLLLLSIAGNYATGILIEDAPDLRRKKLYLTISMLFNLALISYFKYANFFVDSINHMLPEPAVDLAAIALPIGISFYTFQAISYDIDVYRQTIRAQRSFVDLALYISFFPQLIAGPIVKYHDIEAQLGRRNLAVEDTAYGVRRFLYGLTKKVLIANSLARVADEIFLLNPDGMSAPAAWFGILCYTLQIYYDFSGYSDMAIGLGKMFGFTFMENFNYPYLSKSIQEFWRRWHISLSTWFKEYLYIPLGGSRAGDGRTYCNLIVVFLATGLWHGANWTFVLWGLFHGVFLIIERLGWKRLLERRGWSPVAHLYALLVVIFGLVLFRSDTVGYAFGYWQAMFRPGSLSDLAGYCNWMTLVPFAVGILCCGPLQQWCPRLRARLYDERFVWGPESVMLMIFFGLSIISIASGSYNPFIYFRF